MAEKQIAPVSMAALLNLCKVSAEMKLWMRKMQRRWHLKFLRNALHPGSKMFHQTLHFGSNFIAWMLDV